MSKITALLILMSIACQGQELSYFKAYNGIEFEYEIILPEGFNQDKRYELAIVFTEVEKLDESFEEMRSAMGMHTLKETILCIPKVPLRQPHWKSHPIHHALNALMDKLRTEYGEADQDFHFIGYKAGNNVAQTYTSMSREYVASLSIVHSSYWSKNKQEYFDNVTEKNMPVFVYEPNKGAIKMDLSKTTFVQEADWKRAFNLIDQRLGKL